MANANVAANDSAFKALIGEAADLLIEAQSHEPDVQRKRMLDAAISILTHIEGFEGQPALAAPMIEMFSDGIAAAYAAADAKAALAANGEEH